MSRSKERAEKHWDHYVGPMQRVILEQMVEMCMSVGRFHYISSHIHGVKHAEQDADEVARGALANAAAHKAPSLCDSEVLDFSLPSIILEGDGEACRRKYEEEMVEWRCESDRYGSLEYLTELWDVLQAVQTWNERDPSEKDAKEELVAIPNILQAHILKCNPVEKAKATMLVKNAARSYYAPEVCKIILESNGKRWR